MRAPSRRFQVLVALFAAIRVAFQASTECQGFVVADTNITLSIFEHDTLQMDFITGRSYLESYFLGAKVIPPVGTTHELEIGPSFWQEVDSVFPFERQPSIGDFPSILLHASGAFLVEEGDRFGRRDGSSGANLRFGTQFQTEEPLQLPGFGEHFVGIVGGCMFCGTPDEFDAELYGWAKLSITADGVELLDNAVSYFDPRGIIVGSDHPIPEPASITLISFAIAGLMLRGTRSRQAL